MYAISFKVMNCLSGYGKIPPLFFIGLFAVFKRAPQNSPKLNPFPCFFPSLERFNLAALQGKKVPYASDFYFW